MYTVAKIRCKHRKYLKIKKNNPNHKNQVMRVVSTKHVKKQNAEKFTHMYQQEKKHITYNRLIKYRHVALSPRPATSHTSSLFCAVAGETSHFPVPFILCTSCYLCLRFAFLWFSCLVSSHGPGWAKHPLPVGIAIWASLLGVCYLSAFSTRLQGPGSSSALSAGVSPAPTNVPGIL